MITLIAKASSLKATSNVPLTTGSVGTPVSVTLSTEFEGLSPVLVFRCGVTEADVPMDGTKISVPSQCLEMAGEDLEVGIYANKPDGTLAIPTVWAKVGTVKEGTVPSGIDPAEPTPSWAAQVQQHAADAVEAAGQAAESATQAATSAQTAEELAQSVRDDADSGKFDGAQGPQGERGPQGPKGEAPDGCVISTAVSEIWVGTQAQYDAIPKSATTLYLIKEE